MILFLCPNLVLISVIFSISHAAENVTSTSSEDGPFFFTREPEGQTIREGEEARLNCTLDREPSGLKYYWYKYDNESVVEESLLQLKDSSMYLLEKENAKELNFSSISRNDRGYYQCKVQTDSYTIFSSIAYIEVNYFDEPAAQVTTEPMTVPAYKDELYLPCETFESSPVVDVFWNKDKKRISNERMFVYPEDYYNYGQGKITRGTLLILNVQPDEDSGKYECQTEETEEFPETLLSAYTVNVGDKAVSEAKETVLNPVFSSYPDGVAGPGSVTVESGGTVTLACAAKGNPIPAYTWTFGDSDIKIVTTESRELKDHNRRLVVNNIEEYSEFVCTMSNTANERPQERESRFYITVKEKTKSSDIEFIDRTSDSSVKILKPNQYKPFTMECYVRKKSNYRILWLKNGNKTDWISRDRIDVQQENQELDTEGVTFYFETPNESDLGVYQCVVVSTEGAAVSVKQQTSYITLEKDSLTVDSRSRQPNYLFLPGPFYVDKAEEACRAMNMHLVSILDLEENQAVLDLVRNNNVTNVWIGLTREVPEPIGTWKWTLPGDVSFAFSNWDHEKPDNHYGHQEYAVMQNETGKWEDVKRDTWRRPAVCKNYTIVCPSVDEFYQGRVRVRGWESAGTTYYVGQQVEVFCRFPKDKKLRSAQVITCGQDTNFDQLTMDDCLDHDSFFLTVYPSSASASHPHVFLILLYTVFAVQICS